MDNARRPEYKKLERKQRRWWLNLFKENPEINIFHVEKYERDLTELDTLKI